MGIDTPRASGLSSFEKVSLHELVYCEVELVQSVSKGGAVAGGRSVMRRAFEAVSMSGLAEREIREAAHLAYLTRSVSRRAELETDGVVEKVPRGVWGVMQEPLRVMTFKKR